MAWQRRLLFSATVTACLCAVPVPALAQGSASPVSAAPVSTAPIFAASFKDFDRKMQPLAQYQGKPLVLYFWATWCKSCVEEVPELVGAHRKYKSKGLAVVGIAVDNADKVQKFVKDHGIDYPMYLGGNEALDLSRQLGNTVKGLPFVVIVDAQGRVVERILGETPKGKLEGVLKPLMG